MSVKEFWDNDPDLFWAYRFSYINKYKEQQKIDNMNAWVQGAYFYEALSAALSSFGKKSIPYRNKPFDFYESSTHEKEIKSNLLEEKIKARAKIIEKLLGGATDEQYT